MRKIALLAACLAAAFIAGCAKSPDSIAPSYVSDISYKPLSCGDLAIEDARLRTALTRASAQQENARGGDIVGVLLIGVPVSTLSGDNIAPEVARLKGEVDAVGRVSLEKKCS